ncbi:hypothetical protein AB0L70_06405 [Kribbella sp. NPDC051952]|uniref:hypothetical protein n=1 Tax=Kribbella sp. NPDC051952 TaxID=3154851 RepID=UPI003432B823
MSGNYGIQVIESVAVRRRRLRETWLFGAERARNTLHEQTGKLFASVLIGAVACAGCAGVSYFKSSQAKENQKNQPAQTTAPVAPSPSSSTTSQSPSASASGR